MFGRDKENADVIETLPMVPLRDVVVFPHMMIPFVIGRPSSIKALEYALVKHELEAQEWLRDQIEARDAELEGLEVMVARATLGIRSHP